MNLSHPLDALLRDHLKVATPNQAEFAKAIGRSNSWLNKYMHGDGNATIDDVVRMLALLIGVETAPVSALERKLLKALRAIPEERREDAVVAMTAVSKAGVYCFPHRRTAKHMRDVRGAIRRLLKRACQRCVPPIPYGRGIGITFHTATRATGATRMLRAGFDARTVQAIGNWKDFRAMQTYLHPDSAHLHAAVNAIAPMTPALRGKRKREKHQ